MNRYSCLYVKVIEAQGVVVKGVNDNCEPFVTVKLNGHEYLHKRKTKFHSGVEWWEHTFRFKIRNMEVDWVTVELREKGVHLVSSDWIGEVQLRARDFKDGHVYENWYQLGKASWKSHTRSPRGFIHLAIQMKDAKYDRPFEDEPKIKRLSFDEWKQQGMPMPGVMNARVEYTGTDTNFPQTFDTIEEAEHKIGKDAWRILMTEKPSLKEIADMKKLNRVNCLHKGNFDSCQGKRYMICIDGSKSAKESFLNALKLINPEKDHLFIVTVREKAVPNDYFEESNKVILTHKLWRAAAGIITTYQEELSKLAPTLNYTSILPEADDAREMACALVKKYRVDVLVIAKHKDNEVRHQSKYFRSFQRYCQGHAKCTVMTF